MDDIICFICTILEDYDKLNFLSVSSLTHKLKSKIFFNESISMKKIMNIWYFDRFTNIITNPVDIYPKCILRLEFGYNFNSDIKNCILPNVTHLNFGTYFNQDIKDCIPPSITHLTFGYYFNQDIKDCIHLSIKHLNFGYYFNQDIKDNIPPNITHLIFGWNFDQDITNCIPPSVTHLTLSKSYENITAHSIIAGYN